MKPVDIEQYLIYKEINKYFYYLLNFSIIEPYCKNWSKNRCQDENKVLEMYSTYCETNHLPFFLHLAYDKSEKMICYDGNHRMKVLEKLLRDDKIDVKIFISVMWNCSFNDIFIDFQNLNKQSAISDLYIEKAKYSDQFINQTTQFVNQYTNKYKAFVKVSNNPKAPHFVVDKFKDEIISIYDKLPVEKKNLLVVKELFDKYENFIKTSVVGSDCKVYQKCKQYDFWLFYKKPLDIDKIISFL